MLPRAYIAHSAKHREGGAICTHMGWGQGSLFMGACAYRRLGLWARDEGTGIYRHAHAKAGERGGDSIDPRPAPPSIDPPPCVTGGAGGHSTTPYLGL